MSSTCRFNCFITSKLAAIYFESSNFLLYLCVRLFSIGGGHAKCYFLMIFWVYCASKAAFISIKS